LILQGSGKADGRIENPRVGGSIPSRATSSTRGFSQWMMRNALVFRGFCG